MSKSVGLGPEAFTPDDDQSARVPAAITFLIAASGTTMLGVGAAFWALAGGLIAWAALTRGERREPANGAQAAVKP